jgi:hypothetical protein
MIDAPPRPHGALIGRQDLNLASARVFGREARLVGWGTGSVFEDFHDLFPVRLDYLVDNDAGRWGQTRHGIEVVGPDRLVREAGADVFVVIYSSAWPEIQAQIDTLGPFASLPASAVFADASARARLSWAEQVAATAPRTRSPQSANAIIVQGPIWHGVTAQVLRVTSALHPDDVIVLSTWSDTAPEALEEAAPLVDEIVLSDRPASGGIQHRNYQIVSTRAGIARAAERGAQRILKTRSDMAVLADGLFDKAQRWMARLDQRAATSAGLRHRLIVPSSFTRKFVLYHPSDMVMLGAAPDMVRYWSAPLDPRTGELLAAPWIDRAIVDVSAEGNPAESYLGTQFCRAIGRPMLGTLADSWAFYRDLFAVVDNDWFDLLWYKNLSIPDATVRRGVRQTISQGFWERLDSGRADIVRDAAGIDPTTLTMRALCGGPQ